MAQTLMECQVLKVLVLVAVVYESNECYVKVNREELNLIWMTVIRSPNVGEWRIFFCIHEIKSM
jgi:hypothetical protein